MPPVPKPSLLRRAWLGWAVAGTLIAASAGLSYWLVTNTERLSDEVRQRRDAVEIAERRVTRLQIRIAALTEDQQQARETARECLQAAEDGRAYTELVDEAFGLVRAQSFDRGEATAERADRFRRDSNRSLRQCRGTSAGT